MVQTFQGLDLEVTPESQPNLHLVKQFGTVSYFETLNYNYKSFLFHSK